MEDLKKAQTNYCFGGCFRNLDGEIIFKVEKWIDNHRSRGGIWGIWRVRNLKTLIVIVTMPSIQFTLTSDTTKKKLIPSRKNAY